MKLHKRMPPGSSIIEKLEAYSIPEPNSGCWLWIASYMEPSGYGSIWNSGQNMYAHRVSYQTYVGPIPEGKCVLHHCDTPPCINPNHLFLGTHRDNTDDKVKKTRQAFGERNGMAKLTEPDVLTIVVLLQTTNLSHKDIGTRYGVGHCAIASIRHGDKWAYLTGSTKIAPIKRKEPEA